MPSEPLRRPHSRAFRGAVWITLIALFTTAVALNIQYQQTISLMESRSHAIVDEEALGLLSQYERNGLVGVVDAIRQQQQPGSVDEFFYLLAAADGTPIAGNLLSWPAEVRETGFHSFTTDVLNTRGTFNRRIVEARAIALDRGYRLLVGSFADERAILRDRYADTLFWSLLATGVLGLFLGWWHSRRGLRFVETASDSGDRFLEGNLGERLPVSERGDEYDRLAQTINRSFEEVERLVVSLRAATDGMAHDLKTPLTRIKSRIELSEMAPQSEEAMRETFAEIRHDLDLLLVVIEDVLALARAEALGTEDFADVSLDSIVLETVELFEPVAEEKNITIEHSVHPATIRGSRSLLARVVTNIIDNAIKYSPSGGAIQVILETRGPCVALSIADEGSGIPAEKRERVLDRFYRMDSSRSLPGSGIGLSIVATAARLHGANLKLLDNTPGLRVEMLFPVRE